MSRPQVLVMAKRHGKQLVVRCPYCGYIHYHRVTGPNVGDGDGHRLAHCNATKHRLSYVLRERRPDES